VGEGEGVHEEQASERGIFYNINLLRIEQCTCVKGGLIQLCKEAHIKTVIEPARHISHMFLMLQNHFSQTDAVHYNMDPGPPRHGQRFWSEARDHGRQDAGPESEKREKKRKRGALTCCHE
jgi:hypothetical protein